MSEIKFVPLSELQHSPHNVRTTAPDVSDLVGSIRAHGLLKNLVVVPASKGGGFEVVAGGRRLRALQQLHAAGELPPDQRLDEEVPCRVLPADANLEEISLAENVGHQPMHPADEYIAFAELQSRDGLSNEEIGARFGKSARYIEQRLRLGNISPAIMKLYREDKIQLSQVMALALTEDHGVQEKVWKGARGEWAQRPERLREEITSKELSVEDDAIAAYLGVKDYEKGGGQARRDLFGDERDAWLPDSKLARKLANEKLHKEVKKLEGEGWLWVDTRLEFDSGEQGKFSVYGDRYIYQSRDRTDWPAAAKKYAGAMITIGHGGKVVIFRGLLKPADAKRLKDESKGKTKKTPDAGVDAKPAKKPGDLSFAQVQRLQGDRTAVLRAELATKPRIALAALAADLAEDVLLEMSRYGSRVINISQDRNAVPNVNIRTAVELHPRTAEMAKLEQEWEKRLKPAKDDLFGWLLKQPESVTHELLAFCAASALVAGENFDKTSDRGAAFAITAGVDMVDHWQVSEEWLSNQPKGVSIAAVTEALGKKAAADLEKLSKPLAAARAAELLKDAGWLPKPLRAPKPKAPRKAKKAAG